MRIRSTSLGVTLMWLLLAVGQIMLATLRLKDHLAAHHTIRIREDIAILALWGLVLALYLYQLLFSRVAFDADRLRIYNGIGHTSVRYNTIVAIRRAWLNNGKPIPNAVELEIAGLDAAIYPHQYLVIRSANSTTLANAILQHVPHATYDIA